LATIYRGHRPLLQLRHYRPQCPLDKLHVLFWRRLAAINPPCPNAACSDSGAQLVEESRRTCDGVAHLASFAARLLCGSGVPEQKVLGTRNGRETNSSKDQHQERARKRLSGPSNSAEMARPPPPRRLATGTCPDESSAGPRGSGTVSSSSMAIRLSAGRERKSPAPFFSRHIGTHRRMLFRWVDMVVFRARTRKKTLQLQKHGTKSQHSTDTVNETTDQVDAVFRERMSKRRPLQKRGTSHVRPTR
jgi:hypothetical protein